MNLMMVESQENPKPSAKVRPAPRPPAIARRSPSRSIPPKAMFSLLRLRPGRPRRAAGDRPARRRGGDSGEKSGSSSIDIYAVQCGKCHKWRVIDSQEEYEEIRSNFSGNPFYCSRKPGISCNDAADIEYNSSRTWVIDKPNLPKTPEGFKRSLVLRKDFTKLDAYYITPSGKKMRTRNEIAAFLEANPEYKGVSISEFSFHCPKIVEDTIPEHVEKRVSGGGSGSNKKSKTMKDQE